MSMPKDGIENKIAQENKQAAELVSVDQLNNRLVTAQQAELLLPFSQKKELECIEDLKKLIDFVDSNDPAKDAAQRVAMTNYLDAKRREMRAAKIAAFGARVVAENALENAKARPGADS